MGEELTVPLEVLGRASRGADQVADIVRRVSVSDAMDCISQAMPGSRSAGIAQQLGSDWQQLAGEWSAAATTLATNLSAASEGYVAADAATAADFRTLPDVASTSYSPTPRAAT
jgi:hypothetical protein